MTRLLLFHHAQGQATGFLAFAEELREVGHTVHTPDLYDGKTFRDLNEGVAYAEHIGFPEVIRRGSMAARGNVGEVTIELEDSPAFAGERWSSGAYDVLDEMLAFHAGSAETVVERSPGMRTWYLGFNARRPPVDDPRVRVALAHALDRRGAEPLRAVATPTGGLLPPTMPGHSHRVAPGFDPERARAFLGESGYADGRALGEIVLAYLDLWEHTASNVAAQLATFGVRVRLLRAASDAELETAIEKHAHAYVWAWMADYADPGGGFLDPVLRSYPWLHRDEKLEEMLAQAASLRDQDERLRTYREFERIWIGEQAAVVPLAYDDRRLWLRPWVTGMRVSATAISTLADAVVRRQDPAPRRA